MQTVIFANLWSGERWRHDVAVEIDADGRVLAVRAAHDRDRASASQVSGLTLPGLADAHCHAFQRVLPAWTQRAYRERDDFWSWREAMYVAAGALTAEDVEALAARCYLELLRGGYTAVAEFLYLHRLAHRSGVRAQAAHDADLPLARAAARTGIRLTLLPTLYQHGNFGKGAPSPGQLPFVRTSEQFLTDWAQLSERYRGSGQVSLGVAFHSLRAVDIDTLSELSARFASDPRCGALHIHVAEQPAEVEACKARYGCGPVALLGERRVLGPHWALVHATHASAQELELIAHSRAVLVVCPTTEADLGDGVLDTAHFLRSGGILAIGSDSNIGSSALRELRLLEWGARLATGRRNVLASADEPRVAERLLRAVLPGGWQALGYGASGSGGDSSAGLSPARADFVTFDSAEGDWPLQPPENYLSALVFAAAAPAARHVMVGGRWVIRDGTHALQAEIDSRFEAAMMRLKEPLQKALGFG